VRYSLRGLLALRAWVIVGFVVVWNALMLAAVRINGGTGQIVEPTARSITWATMATTSIFAGGILVSRRFRAIVTAPSRRDWYEPAPYWLFCVVCGLLAVLIGLDLE
jgi:hypothetical protein